MGRDSFAFLRSYKEAYDALPKSKRGAFCDVLFSYALDGVIPENADATVLAVFLMAKPNIDNSNARYDANVKNGKKGGRPAIKHETKNPKKPKPNPTVTQKNPTEPNYNPDEPNPNLNVDVDVDVLSTTDCKPIPNKPSGFVGSSLTTSNTGAKVFVERRGDV